MRARLLVRPSISRLLLAPGATAQRLAQEALEMARRVGEPDTLAASSSTPTSRCRPRPTPSGGSRSRRELIEAAERAGDRELAVEGHGMRLIDLLELRRHRGRRPARWRSTRAGARTLREPNYLRFATIRHAMRAAARRPLRHGRADPRASTRRRTPGTTLEPNTVQAFAVVRVRAAPACRARSAEMRGGLPALRRAVHRGAGVAHRGSPCSTSSSAGPTRRSAELDALVRATTSARCRATPTGWSRCRTSPRSSHRLGEREHAAALYEELLPFAHRNVVVGGGWVCWGSISRYLGLPGRDAGALRRGREPLRGRRSR